MPKSLYIPKHLLVFKHILGGATMPRITLSIPDDIKERMDKMPEVNWSEVIREGLKDKVKKLKQFEEMVGW